VLKNAFLTAHIFAVPYLTPKNMRHFLQTKNLNYTVQRRKETRLHPVNVEKRIQRESHCSPDRRQTNAFNYASQPAASWGPSDYSPATRAVNVTQ